MIVGIDLGTTNSLVAVFRDGASILVPNPQGELLTPSVVSRDRFGEILVGEPARTRLGTHPADTAAGFKRLMGTARETTLGGRAFRPEELSSFILRALVADAETFLGTEITEAVITVPAYFSDAQRRATRVAGELAGLRVDRVLNEPTAAALAYGLHERLAPASQHGKILVFDLGGGTFDVSVIEMFDGVIEVRATAGDNYLGGDDFDTAIIAWFAAETAIPIPDEFDPAARPLAADLRRAAETARKRLSTADTATLSVTVDHRSRTATLSADQFAALARPLLDRLRQPVARALADSRIRTDELAAVVLAGGATRMPLVRRLAATMLGHLPLHTLDPDRIVGLGAGVQAGLKMRDAALRDVVLTDVAAYTLGIEIVESLGAAGFSSGRLLPLIERNTVVPVSRKTTVAPVQDFQDRVVVRIYQGESRLVKDNIKLGDLTLTLKPRRHAEQQIEVRFTYDTNGILEVAASALADGTIQTMVIEQHAGVLSPAEIAERLAALEPLKRAPRDADANRRLLAQAEHLHERTTGQPRATLAAATRSFETALAAEDPHDIAAAAQKLAAAIAAADLEPK